MLGDLIREFMEKEYSITPPQRSVDILVEEGLNEDDIRKVQINDLKRIQRSITNNEYEPQVARLFVLSYPYTLILREWNGNFTKDWAFNLGCVEYRVGELTKDENNKKRLFKKSLTHFERSNQLGKEGRKVYWKMGSCQCRLKQYEKALENLLIAEKKGHITKENKSFIAGCYFKKNEKEFEKGLEYYEDTLKAIKDDYFDEKWMHAFDHSLKDSFDILKSCRNSIEKERLRQYVLRLQNVYYEFDSYRRNNMKDEKEYHPKLLIVEKGKLIGGEPKDHFKEFLKELNLEEI